MVHMHSTAGRRWRPAAAAGTIEDTVTGQIYKQVAVPADGNCFYSALCGAMGVSLRYANALRAHIGDTLENDRDSILQDIRQHCDPLLTDEAYDRDVANVVQKPGRWDCQLGDSLPFVVARHVLHRSLCILIGDCVLRIDSGEADGGKPPLLLNLRRSHFTYYQPCTHPTRKRRRDH